MKDIKECVLCGEPTEAGDVFCAHHRKIINKELVKALEKEKTDA